MLVPSSRFSSHSQINNLLSKRDQKITQWQSKLDCKRVHFHGLTTVYRTNAVQCVDCFPNSVNTRPHTDWLSLRHVSPRCTPTPRRPKSGRVQALGSSHPHCFRLPPIKTQDIIRRAAPGTSAHAHATLRSCALVRCKRGGRDQKPSADEAQAWRLPSPPTRGRSQAHAQPLPRRHRPVWRLPCARTS